MCSFIEAVHRECTEAHRAFCARDATGVTMATWNALSSCWETTRDSGPVAVVLVFTALTTEIHLFYLHLTEVNELYKP